jgi:4-hydroxybenzoyl-CoA reductase subunit beta
VINKVLFFQPDKASEGLAFLEGTPAARVIAGGTDLAVLLKDRLIDPTALVGLSRIDSLRGEHSHSDQYTIGSMTPLWQLERSDLLAGEYPALREAIHGIAAPPIRNQATLGGNLCLDTKCIYYNQSQVWERRLPHCFKAGGDVCHVDPGKRVCSAVLSADSIGPLCAYEAQIEIASVDCNRHVPVTSFLTGDGLAPHDLRPEEIVTAIHFPVPGPNQGVAYDRYSYRKALEFSQINLTAAVKVEDGGAVVEARLIVGAVGPAPDYLRESLEPLVGAPLALPLTTAVTAALVAECLAQVRSSRLTPHLQSVLAARSGIVLETAYRRAVGNITGG